MSTSPDFGLPFIASQQGTPEVTHNEGLLMIQALLCGVITQQNAPPGSPTPGDAYLVGAAPTGAWAGKANKVAIYITGGWRFIPDKDSDGTDIPIGARHVGMKVYRRDMMADYVWAGTSWVLHTDTVGSV